VSGSNEKRLPPHITEDDVRLICEITLPSVMNPLLAQIADLKIERDAALAVIAGLEGTLPEVLDTAESAVYQIHSEWGTGILPDDDEDLVAIYKVRAVLSKAAK
jgi:hypothetical protein